MSMAFLLGGLFIFVIMAFVAGMIFLPELFGISENAESDMDDNKSEK